MPHQKLKPHFIFDENRLIELKRIAPEAFADGEINWDTLKEALGNHLEEDGPDSEHFGLSWAGKRKARQVASVPSKGTLVPTGEGLDEETTRNIFIEGENLEVLKLLQKSYAGRIKMIYIDPPYNTGNDFVYEDDFKEPLDEYLKRTGQVDEEGKALTTNTKADGRYHSKWLSMMYPRLRLARNLLKDDGVLFVSIDDNEMFNLKELLNEVFGEENFASLIIVQTNPRGRTFDKYIAKTHEYLLVYTKDSDEEGLSQIQKTEKAKAAYSLSDKDGNFRLLELRNRNPVFNKSNRPNLFFPIYLNETTGKVSLSKSKEFNLEVLPLNSKEEEGCWTWGKSKIEKNISLLFGKRASTGALRIFRKDYLSGSSEFTKAKSVWLDSNLNHENGKEEITKLFGFSPFDFPKSPHLIKKCIEIGSPGNEEDIVLDFFAGSGTTAHAVFLKNAEDLRERKFILSQIDFVIEGEDSRIKKLKTISNLSIERIKLAAKSFKKHKDIDLGFKVFKLENSNFKQWNNYEGQSVKELEKQFDLFSTPLVEGWKEKDLLTEIILMEGFPLDSNDELLKHYKKNKLHEISSDFVEHKLLVCLDKKIDKETISALALSESDIFICLDNAISDEAKVRLADKGTIKTI